MYQATAAHVLRLEKGSEGMKIGKRDKFECKICVEGKMFQNVNHKSDAKASNPVDLVYTDLPGPILPLSLENSKYCISFVDDFSGLIIVYLMKNKSFAAGATAMFLTDVAPYDDVKSIRSDNGGETPAT